MNRPNILFVFGDQWRAQSTGFSGNQEVRTPHLDRFAGDALHLPQAIASCPVCTPWRGTFLTGMNPDRHGLFLNDAPLDPALPTIGKAFTAAGYETGWIGKWHVDGHGRLAYILPERRHGFQYWKTLECTHRYHESYYYAGDSDQRLCWEGYDAIAQTEDATRWLRSRGTEAPPFFLVLSWGPPHNPYLTAPEEFQRLYDPQALSVPQNIPEDMRTEKWRQNLAGYYAHCSALDHAFGQLLDTLDTLGLRENTIVVFTSDHGDLIGAHGLYDKQAPWDESVRVPFLLRWPAGLTAAGTASELVFQTTDFYPTLCSLAGVEIPSGAQLQGRDCSDWLRHGTLPQDNEGFLAAYHTFGNWPRQAERRDNPLVQAREYRGVRTPRHTYVVSRESPWLLYDNGADPCQLQNRVHDPALAQVQADLDRRLRRFLAAYDDSFEPGMEYVRRWGYRVDDSGTLGWPDAEAWRKIGM